MARSKQLKRLEPWHHYLIDWMLANPERSGREAAAQFKLKSDIATVVVGYCFSEDPGGTGALR